MPLGYVPDVALSALYASALALVYPSVYEGFGLPPLEAMACGTPVIVSNRASLPEVVGSAGDLVEPDDVAGLTSAIVKLSEDGSYFARRSAQCLARANEFTWMRCATETLGVYRRVLQGR
jgi:alpha-1,3-rhamnosyl/mannosyltransferase